MKASFDGARKRLATAYNSLASHLYDGPENIDQETLTDQMEDLRSCIGGLLCMYDPTDTEDCNEIHIKLVSLDD
jgi:hypothetical protein